MAAVCSDGNLHEHEVQGVPFMNIDERGNLAG